MSNCQIPGRQTRHQWADRVAGMLGALGFGGVAPAPPRPKTPGLQLRLWLFNSGSETLRVRARTRSEARALIKRILHLQRLPAGCTPLPVETLAEPRS